MALIPQLGIGLFVAAPVRIPAPTARGHIPASDARAMSTSGEGFRSLFYAHRQPPRAARCALAVCRLLRDASIDPYEVLGDVLHLDPSELRDAIKGFVNADPSGAPDLSEAAIEAEVERAQDAKERVYTPAPLIRWRLCGRELGLFPAAPSANRLLSDYTFAAKAGQHAQLAVQGPRLGKNTCAFDCTLFLLNLIRAGTCSYDQDGTSFERDYTQTERVVRRELARVLDTSSQKMLRADLDRSRDLIQQGFQSQLNVVSNDLRSVSGVFEVCARPFHILRVQTVTRLSCWKCGQISTATGARQLQDDKIVYINDDKVTSYAKLDVFDADERLGFAGSKLEPDTHNIARMVSSFWLPLKIQYSDHECLHCREKKDPYPLFELNLCGGSLPPYLAVEPPDSFDVTHADNAGLEDPVQVQWTRVNGRGDATVRMRTTYLLHSLVVRRQYHYYVWIWDRTLGWGKYDSMKNSGSVSYGKTRDQVLRDIKEGNNRRSEVGSVGLMLLRRLDTL